MADDWESHANRTRRGCFAACCPAFLGNIAQFLGSEPGLPPLPTPARGRARRHRGELESSLRLRAISARGRRGLCVWPEVGRWVKVLPARTLGGDPTSYPALRGGHTVCSIGPLISRRAQFRGQRQHNDLFGSAARDLEG